MMVQLELKHERKFIIIQLKIMFNNSAETDYSY